MRNINFINYLKTITNKFTFTDSFIDESKNNTICVYQRSGTAPLSRRVGFKFYPCTIIITNDKNASEAQNQVNDIFDLLFEQNEQEIDGINFNMIINNNPRFLGRTDAGYFRYALDIDIYF